MAKPSKYAHVVGNLPRLVAEAPERRALLDGLREEIRNAQAETTYNVDAQVRSALDALDTHIEAVLALAKLTAAGRPQASAFAQGYAQMRRVKDRIADWASSAQLLLDAYEGLMIEQMEAEDVASLRMVDGSSVSTFVEPYGQVVDKEAFRRWCVANGYEDKLQLWPATMNAIAKERTLSGEAPPDGVEVFAKTMIRLNKG